MKLFQAYHLLPVIFLSLIAISVAGPKYAKEGCNDMCGNTKIPFPFGIGAKCSFNKWYDVDCNSNTPYLSALNHLQVVGVDLENQTVTVKMPRISDCSNNMSIDLDSSPFLYSKSHNKFVFEGCGNAFILDQHGSVLTGCSTDCGNNTVSEKNKCLGINCCETTIPHYLKSYWVDVTRMERQGGDEACGTAFMVDKNSYSYDEGRFSDSSSFIPTSLLWTLSELDYRRNSSCCRYSYSRPLKVDLGNGTLMDTWKCQFSEQLDYAGNIYLEDGCNVTAKQIATLKYAKPGCKDTCGSVRIPYPFGIGAKCSINKWYTVDCNSSKPYLPALNHLQVVGVDLENQTVTVNTPAISNCSNGGPIVRTSIVLDRSPFFFSKSQNIFVFEGCGNAVMMDQYGSALTGCTANCHNNTASGKNNCLGITCCQTSIPHHLKSYFVNITELERQGRDGGCGSAFLVDKNSYDRRNFFGRFVVKDSSSSIPISLMWILSELDFDQVSCCKEIGRYRGEYSDGYIDGYRVKVDLGNGTAVDTLQCVISENLDGNPYLIDGCDYGSGTEECRSCRRSGGLCDYDTVTDVDGLVYQQNFSCIYYKRYPRPDLSESRSSSLGVIRAYYSDSP